MYQNCTEPDVAREMVRKEAALIVDNFENASPEIVSRITGLARLLTQSITHSNAKIIVIGTGDVYFRILKQNPSLRDRISQVTLGSLPEAGWSWSFLQKGFELLNLKHPGNSKYSDQQKKNEECGREIFNAADGFLKSLNRLGYEISVRAIGRNAVSAKDIIDKAREMLVRNWIECQTLHTEWLKTLRDPISKMVFEFLYRGKGVGAVYQISEILEPLCSLGLNELQILLSGSERQGELC